MKITNLSANFSKQLKPEPIDIKTIEQGVTMKLLKKYKPKHLYKLEDISKNKKQREA